MKKSLTTCMCMLLISVGALHTRKTPRLWEFFQDLKIMNKKLTVLRIANYNKPVTSKTMDSSTDHSPLVLVLSQKQAGFDLNADNNTRSDLNSATTLITTIMRGVKEAGMASRTVWNKEYITRASGTVAAIDNSRVTQDVKDRTPPGAQTIALRQRYKTELTTTEPEMPSTIFSSKVESMSETILREQTEIKIRRPPIVYSKLGLFDVSQLRTTYEQNPYLTIVSERQSNKRYNIMFICLFLSACLMMVMAGMLIFIFIKNYLKSKRTLHGKKKRISLNVIALESVGLLPNNKDFVKCSSLDVY